MSLSPFTAVIPRGGSCLWCLPHTAGMPTMATDLYSTGWTWCQLDGLSSFPAVTAEVSGETLIGSDWVTSLFLHKLKHLWLAKSGSRASSWCQTPGGQSHLNYLNSGWGLRIRGWMLGQAETTNMYYENRVQSCLFYEAFSHYFTLLQLEWPGLLLSCWEHAALLCLTPWK